VGEELYQARQSEAPHDAANPAKIGLECRAQSTVFAGAIIGSVRKNLRAFLFSSVTRASLGWPRCAVSSVTGRRRRDWQRGFCFLAGHEARDRQLHVLCYTCLPARPYLAPLAAVSPGRGRFIFWQLLHA